MPRTEKKPDVLPTEGAVTQARVVGIKPFGAFVELDGCSTHALVHISQVAPRRIDTVEEVVSVGDVVYVLILAEEKPGRLSASMKQVDQATGAVLDVGSSSGGGGGPRRGRGAEEDMSSMTWGLQPLDRGGDDGGGDGGDGDEDAPKAPKHQPNYETTGKLAEESNKVNGVVLKWSEPQDAAKPVKRWRLYVFKGKEALEPYHIHRQSAYDPLHTSFGDTWHALHTSLGDTWHALHTSLGDTWH